MARIPSALPASQRAGPVPASARFDGEVRMSSSAAVLDASILVVDDTAADARLIEAMLRGNGYSRISTTSDPFSVCDLHLKRAYDLIILDVLMPGLDGFEVLDHLHALDPELPVPVIMVTAEPDHMKRALEGGARDFIGKPVRMVELLSRVRNALELGLLLKVSRARGRLLERDLRERTADLEESEARFRAIVEQSIAGIYTVQDGHFTYANPRMCEMLDYDLEQLRRIPSIDLVHPDDRERVLENRRRRESGEATGFNATFRIVRRDGKVVHLSMSGKVLEVKGRTILLGVAQDVTERVLAAQLLENANQRLRGLSQRVLAIQEEERRHISRELHDDVGQSLLALNIGMHRLEKHVDTAHRGLLDECIAVTAAVQEKLRELSVQLHPPHLDQLGLQDALRWLVNRQRQLTGIAVECRFAGEIARVPPAIEAACYRICQEALTNATRHARAASVVVDLKIVDGRLEVSIADDGVGFDEAAQREALHTSGSLGLISMEERARLAGGRLELDTAPGAGTRVKASFPIDATSAESVRRRANV